MNSPTHTATHDATVCGELRRYFIRAANAERILYDCEWAYDANGNCPHNPVRNLTMKPANFAAYVGWTPS